MHAHRVMFLWRFSTLEHRIILRVRRFIFRGRLINVDLSQGTQCLPLRHGADVTMSVRTQRRRSPVRVGCGQPVLVFHGMLGPVQGHGCPSGSGSVT